MNYSNDVKIMILKNRISLLEARGGDCRKAKAQASFLY